MNAILTDEKIAEVASEFDIETVPGMLNHAFARAIEAAVLSALAEKDADAVRLNFMIDEGAQVETLTLPSGSRYRVRWPDLDCAHEVWRLTAREAIDAALQSAGDGDKTA